MSAGTLIRFRDERESRGIRTTPELSQAIQNIAEREADDKWYAAQTSWLVRWWHRRHCMRSHK